MISGLHNNCTTYYIRHDGHCGNASDDDNNRTKDNHHDGDYYNNHSANQNNDAHDDDGDNGIASDHNHADDNGTGSDHNHNDDDDNDGHDQNDIELVLIFLLLLITLLLFHHHLFLVSYHIFMWQIVKCISCVPRLVNRRTRVVCIGNKSYHNTFRLSSRLTLVEVQNINITADVIQRNLAYYFRRRYSQCIILYNKPLINFAFQASPLCCYSTANYNFQTRFVNMITYNLNLYHGQGNVLIMLLNSGEQFMFMSMRRKQKLVLLWQHFPSRFHKISVLILCEVKDDKSCFNIIAMTFQNANSTTNIFIKTLWLKWINNYFLCNCNDIDATPLLSLRILDMQLHMPEFLTYNLQVQSSIRQTNLNIATVNNKQTKSSTNCLMIWLRYVCEGQTIDAIKLVTVSNTTVYKLDLHQDASCFQQHNDSMLCSFCNNHSDVHLMEIQFRILFNRLEMHLFVNTYHFLRELIHEDLELRRIVAINFLSVYETQLLVQAYSQTSLLDSPDEVKMVLECTFEGLRETMKHAGIYY